MTDSQSPAPPAEALRLVQENAPAIPSPLNPEVRGRSQRERKETAKKREATRGTTPTVPAKRKATGASNGRHATTQSAPSPMRYQIPPPKTSDYEPPKPPVFTSHEPLPYMTPDGKTELKKVTDQAENKRAYRYTLAVADPNFRHKQFYRQSDGLPYGARMSFEDADRSIHYDTSGHMMTNGRGWRMARANVCAREGSFYYEVRVVRGVPTVQSDETKGPQPHVRVGWARREAPLDAPVGFDGYSYGISDLRFEPMHRSRPSKFFHPRTSKTKANTPIQLSDSIREGDVVGLEITLPSLSLHQKVVEGHYNPAVDLGDGFEEQPPLPDPSAEPHHIIRDRIPVPYKGNVYFETMDYVSSKPVEAYADRTLSLTSLSTPAPGAPTSIKSQPGPHHQDPPLRTLPHSNIRVYKNGHLIGTAFENLLAFLPPASQVSKAQGAREGFDDGMLGYFPAIACFSGGIAELNFGENGFWYPPAHLKPVPEIADTSDSNQRFYPGRSLRPIAERYKEQIAEDIVWDVLDEVDFFLQDGSFGGKVGAGANAVKKGVASLKEEMD
ncbi:Set1C complex protein [Aureobasidium sp. EXF-10727]|nr:Set1C complex protein [Aureobasidium sp. EXF-10727]